MAPGSICWKIAEDMDWRRSEKAKPKPKAMCFYFFMLLQYFIYNAVNTFDPFDIFAVRMFLLPCSCKSKQVFSI